MDGQAIPPPPEDEDDGTPRSEAQRLASVRATLSRIRIAGFKSFAEATTVEVRPGLTGIVGPNGCGKSNVVEALRWAMGETSAKAMRGGEMDDVIFAGTATRPGRNLAEVTLQLEEAEGLAPPPNQDQAELEIIRRITRGQGIMPSHAAQVLPDDRWRVIHHLRQLQGVLPRLGEGPPPAAAGATP